MQEMRSLRPAARVSVAFGCAIPSERHARKDEEAVNLGIGSRVVPARVPCVLAHQIYPANKQYSPSWGLDAVVYASPRERYLVPRALGRSARMRAHSTLVPL